MDAPAGDGESGQPTPADYRAQEADWQMAVAQAAQSARSRGLLPGGIESVIEEALQPKAPWQALLREFLTRTARDDYAWTPPNRRHAWNGLYLPSTRSERCGPVVLGIDTSGSVSDEMLAQFEGELNAILEDVKPEVVHVVYCDARVTGTEAYEPDDLPVRLTPRGRGGTAFRPVFDWVEENLDDPPACLVYLTDMYGEPVDDPGYPVLWADYEGGRGPDQPCGERVVID
jgi:predicted metal-dependent peptidase